MLLFWCILFFMQILSYIHFLVAKYLYIINYFSTPMQFLYAWSIFFSKYVLTHPFIQKAFSGVCISSKGV